MGGCYSTAQPRLIIGRNCLFRESNSTDQLCSPSRVFSIQFVSHSIHPGITTAATPDSGASVCHTLKCYRGLTEIVPFVNSLMGKFISWENKNG